MAKLSEADTDNKDTIVWIDDPVSSLDCNHIFFVFSLIKNLLASPITNSKKVSKFKQLFISTHDLEFLKYLKKLSKDDKHQYFLIQKSGDESTINIMPSYLKEYVTEFNYLFHQIYKCAKKDCPTDNPEYYYDFGNNLRKFLEIFLFFRYPCSSKDLSEEKKALKFFDDDPLSQTIVNRFIHESSHRKQNPSRSMKPIDIPEFQKIAAFILKTIKAKDPDQYKALLDSINSDDFIELKE